MGLKFQFNFAGADFSRPSSPYRKWLRIILISLAVVLSGLAYWAFIHHLTSGRRPVVKHVAPAVAPVVRAAPAAPATPVALASAAPVAAAHEDVKPPASPMLKKMADASLLAVGNYLIRKANESPTPSVTPVTPALTSQPDPVAVPAVVAVPVVPVAQVVPEPVPVRPYRVHTDQERLLMAGETAFDNVMDMANKYPDAYGFQAGDFLSDAQLGEPMQIYTIEESARANYQSGQPVKPLLKPVKQWVFPVTMGDRFCCMVEVWQNGREYVPGKGNKSLAMAWAKIVQKWPAEDGYHPLLLVNADIPGYYFTVPELPQQNITDTIEMFYFHPRTSPADVILASWR